MPHLSILIQFVSGESKGSHHDCECDEKAMESYFGR